jgi:hypothetical protein
MIQVAILTEEQKNQVHDQFLADAWKFACLLDSNGNWTVRKELIDACDKVEFQWLKELPLVEFQVPVVEQSTTGSL